MALNKYYVPKIEQVVEASKVQLVVSTQDRKRYVLPKVHFLFYKYPGPHKRRNGFEGVCLELGLFAWGTTVDAARNELLEICRDYMVTVITEKNNPNQLVKDCQATDMEELWAVYRTISLIGAAKGHLDVDSQIMEENQKLKAKVEELEQRLAEDRSVADAYVVSSERPNLRLLKELAS